MRVAIGLALLVVSALQAADSGDAQIRAKAGPSEIVITTTSRLAGAIHSLTWNGREFIDSADHGRQLQSAANFDAGSRFSPETFNPTEAGSRFDGAGPKSTSVLHKAAEFAPAMGLIGTLVGLVQMLGNLESPSAIGPAMAVALLRLKFVDASRHCFPRVSFQEILDLIP